ncbi:hypothetical protein [Hyalangium gracile]|uniref:hypothetical protein n=1 Tax=Hyalangium gracile TaxID=394092 RepID=UPI001CCF26DC|nr:hypothetical protein [Hyalangium gracile]
MAERVEVSEAAAPTPPPMEAVAKANAVVTETETPAAVPAQAPARLGRAMAGERWIARILRGGALISGSMFLASLGLEVLPQSEAVHVAIDTLRKGAASLLLVTPVARLVVAGTMLGLRGEWRYTLYAAGVLGLLAIAVGAGISA